MFIKIKTVFSKNPRLKIVFSRLKKVLLTLKKYFHARQKYTPKLGLKFEPFTN